MDTPSGSPSVAALIVAAGRGERFGGAIPKQYRDLSGAPMIRRTAQAFLRHPSVDRVLAVIDADHEEHYRASLGDLPLPSPVPGGATRQESVRRGLEALEAAAPDLVLVHDAARPLVDAGTIDRVIEALAVHPAVIPGVPVVDTLKRAGADGTVGATVDRTGLWRAQTPQGFRFGPLLAAHRLVEGQSLTDDSAVAEAAGLPIGIVEGNEDNMKITSAGDMARAERILGGTPDIRVGNGFDVHRLVPDRPLILCGVTIPHALGLAGHSDADVGLHALTDALLGALGEGDIGLHFPPSDPRWKDADSALFLRHVAAMVAERGGRIGHVDVTLICETPKIGPHRAAMVARIAELTGLESGRVSVKATTTERLGFTGRGEGIAAQATATVILP
ncbi:bifunctional 2-C-methyl-D-erythritol 4-phosphate cytidylyltransferase/2-C-methyl-D-erythritol 2,4-cyclodiphosphate synthase [Inquilinus sp. CAU 1745]|uniref:bifunctional 2-C-methyl-D-erythritol 4-phosphate cytidylyltransferase/2-C-methyl-D-erythritol 2,4-cyclodiphosphate synthase n=1 Tax=Inquilinus sp. CAU 1745 TaxID=3140369 RepID=UPI00325B2525